MFIFKYFEKRVIDKVSANKYFTAALSQFKTNISLINQKPLPDLHQMKYLDEARNPIDFIWYKEYLEKNAIEYKIITEVNAGKDQDTINFENGKSLRVSTKELSKILTKNTLNGERATFIPSKNIYKYKSIDAIKKIDKRGLIVTAPGDDSDFVQRCFFPSTGVIEDPVPGLAHTSLIPS